VKQQSYEKLLSNLEEITKQYRLLLDCVRKEKDFLIQNHIEKLTLNNLVKEQLINKIAELDTFRADYASDLAKVIGANSAEPRLLEIAQRIGGAEGDRLRTIHAALELLTKRLVEINKENATYAETALTTVNSAMENIKEAISGPKTYQKKGNYQPGFDKSGHLVRREA
jgi:flagellar biosynthesis/type III secretory pathway chaperone